MVIMLMSVCRLPACIQAGDGFVSFRFVSQISVSHLHRSNNHMKGAAAKEPGNYHGAAFGGALSLRFECSRTLVHAWLQAQRD